MIVEINEERNHYEKRKRQREQQAPQQTQLIHDRVIVPSHLTPELALERFVGIKPTC